MKRIVKKGLLLATAVLFAVALPACSDNDEPTPEEKLTQEQLNASYLQENSRSAINVDFDNVNDNDIIDVTGTVLKDDFLYGAYNFHCLMNVNDDIHVLRNLITDEYPVVAEGAKIDLRSVATSTIPLRFTDMKVVSISSVDLPVTGKTGQNIITDFASTALGELTDNGNFSFTLRLAPNTTGKDRYVTVHLLSTVKLASLVDPDAEPDYHPFEVTFLQYAK